MSRILSKADAPRQINGHEKVLGENDFIVSKTDTRGIITYGNRIFVEMSGYTKSELIGANHNLIRHPEMPATAFKLAWELIRSGREFFGFVKNLCKDGGYYWVFTYITPDVDAGGNIIGFTSVRRKPSQNALQTIIPLYEQMVAAEKHGGMDASMKILNALLEAQEISYDALVIALQKS